MTTPTTAGSRATTEAVAAPAAPPTPAPGRRALAPVPVRIKIAATIALVTAAAMAAAGLLVYVLESAQIDNDLNQQIDQEIAELRALQGGEDPETSAPFDSVDRLLRLYLERNVTDDDEMLVTYVDGELSGASPNQFGEAILSETGYQQTVARLSESGGTAVIDSPQYQEVWVTVVPVENKLDPASTGALTIINYADDERSELDRTIQTYAVVTVCFLGLITMLAIWRAGQLLAPLTSLRETAEAITETDLSLRIAERGNDDITALTRTLNDMLARLEASFVGQRQFLDDAGHELKTPLTVLRGHLELLDASDQEEVTETRELLLDEIDRMSRLVGDLILLAKHDRPDFLTPSAVSVERLTHTLYAKARALADREWVLDEVGEGIAQLDEQRITQAVLQLADNAVKHTGVGDRVGIGSRVAGGRLSLWVSDTGPGIPPELREHVIERFGRAATVPGDEGFGLGLSIVKAIAQAHGGNVRIEDAEPQGAVVVIELWQEPRWHAS